MKAPQAWMASLFAVALFATSEPAARAGVNRWTTGWPASGGGWALALDPDDPRVVYAGGPGSSVFKSADGGIEWDDLSTGKLDGVNVHALSVDPGSSSTLFVGTARGVVKSTDGGSTFRASLAASAIYNLIFASQSSTVYAADFDDVSYYPNPSTVYASTDDGETWTRKTAAFPILPGSLIVHPTQPSLLYAAAVDDFWAAYKSVDAGSTWQPLSPDLRGFFVSALAIDRQSPNRLYAAAYSGAPNSLSAIYKSEDGGSTWRAASTDLANTSVIVLAVDPLESKTLYAATFRGVFRSSDGGVSWQDFNTGLPALDIVALAMDSTGRTLHAASRSLGVFDYGVSSGALDLSVGGDNLTRLLLFDPRGRLVIRSVDRSGNSSSTDPFGPYSGWNSRAVADGADGLTRILWGNDDGRAELWLVGPEGVEAAYPLGDPSSGWTAIDVAAFLPNRSDVLWTDAGGRIAIWSVDNGGDVLRGPAWGPYPGWTAVAIADGKDGLSRVLWNRTDGSAGLSLFGPEGPVASYRFGPVAGWSAMDVAVGADGQSRILWTHRDGRMALWRVDDTGNPTALGPIYSPPPGLAAIRIAGGLDGLVRLLWANTAGDAELWILSADNVLLDSVTLPATRVEE